MRRLAAVVAGILFGLPAYGAPGITYTNSIPVGGAANDPSISTQAAMTLYVDPTGSDGNACTGSGTAACATIPGAVNKVPKRIRHAVVINVATNYTGTGAYVEGYSCEPGVSPATGAYIKIVGALANVTPTTGLATGTATSSTAQSGTTFATLVDTAATWTVNDFARKAQIVITGGTGAGQIFAIDSNTATAISIAGAWAVAPDATSTYAIQAAATTLTSALTLPKSPSTEDVPNSTSAAVANYAAFIVDNVRGGVTAPDGANFADSRGGEQACVLIDKLSFAGQGVVVRSSIGVAVRFSKFTSTTSTAVTIGDGSLVKTVANIQTGTLAVDIPYVALNNLALPGRYDDFGSVGTGGVYVAGWANGFGAATGAIRLRSASWSGCNTSAPTKSGCIYVDGGFADIRIQFVKLAATTGNGILLSGTATLSSAMPGSAFFQSVTINNSSVDGVFVAGPWTISDSGGIVGTGNTGYGLRLGNGPRIRVSASDTITGTSGDIVMDNIARTWANIQTIVVTGQLGMCSGVGSCIETGGANPGAWQGGTMFPYFTTLAGTLCTVSNKGFAYLDTTLNQLTICDANAAWSPVVSTSSFVDNAGTAGNQTINAESFRFDIAAAGTQAVITNSEVVAASVVLCNLQTSDATCTGVRRATPAAGSVTVVMVAACTAQATVACSVLH